LRSCEYISLDIIATLRLGSGEEYKREGVISCSSSQKMMVSLYGVCNNRIWNIRTNLQKTICPGVDSMLFKLFIAITIN
jgi:hypothetical protein